MAKIPAFNPKLDNLEFNVEITVAWRFKLRMWIGLRLISWGARVLGAHVNVNHTPESPLVDTAVDAADCAIETLRRTNDAMEARRRGPVRLACGCLDICTDQRPGHPSTNSRGAPIPDTSFGEQSAPVGHGSVELQPYSDMLYYGESFHVERDGQKILTNSRRQSVITGKWEPTYLRWSKPGVLQQRFVRKVIKLRKYGGQERRCESFEEDWRDVPTEGDEDAVGNSERTAGARDDASQTAEADVPGRARDRRNHRAAELPAPGGRPPAKGEGR